MHIPSRKELSQDLSQRLIYSPFLRLVFFSFWFRLAFLCLVFLLTALGLCLPKIWRTTPPGFLPEVRISGLDVAQAWSLRRSALRAAAAGRYHEAAFAWETAVGNNPGNPELLRGSLRNILRIELLKPKYLGSTLWQAAWLLRLTGTNRTDVELAAQVYDKFQLHDQVLRLLTPAQNRLTDPEEGLFLKALFHTGQSKKFAERWGKLGDRQAGEPEMQLYHAAHLAGWGLGERVQAGREFLERALNDPARRVLASRLQMRVAATRRDADAYSEALERMDRWQAATLLEHVRYWQLLAATGNKTGAIALARAYPHPPASAAEAVGLIEAYVTLGLNDDALQFLERNATRFGNSPYIWIAHAELLIEQQHWEDLRVLALQIRRQDGVRDALGGYSYYLDGRAELALGGQPFESGTLGLATASSLLKLGYPLPARDILLPLENVLDGNTDYWQAVFASAFEIRDPLLLLKAATKSSELQPDNIVALNNYAAALLVNRARPQEAVKLTLVLISRLPDSPAAKFNHAVALLLNRRTDEADALLSRVNLKALTPREQASFHLARFEVSLNREEYDRSRELGERIEVKHLFPNQVKWLQEARRQLDAQAAAQ